MSELIIKQRFIHDGKLLHLPIIISTMTAEMKKNHPTWAVVGIEREGSMPGYESADGKDYLEILGLAGTDAQMEAAIAAECEANSLDAMLYTISDDLDPSQLDF